MIYLVS